MKDSNLIYFGVWMGGGWRGKWNRTFLILTETELIYLSCIFSLWNHYNKVINPIVVSCESLELSLACKYKIKFLNFCFGYHFRNSTSSSKIQNQFFWRISWR